MAKQIIFILAALTPVLADINFLDPFGAAINFIGDNMPLIGNHESITVQTTKGLVQGKLATTAGKQIKYSKFLGIPYAKPPLGNLRFRAPQEANPWEGVYKAMKQKDMCPQTSIFFSAVTGNEDCLYLNVYTPKLDETDTEKRAVMVWIHGGGFVSGSGSHITYGPDFLIDENVVVVAMNYRLGVLGFLALNHTEASGNAGLKDQNKALQWVQQNIQNFGGDPEKVTIFGQSAGGASVMYQVVSEASSGLFRSAIAMSGSTLDPWAFVPQSVAFSRGFVIGKALGIETSDPSVLLENLQSVPAKKLVKVIGQVTNAHIPYMIPTLESPKAESPLLTQCTVDKLESGNVNKVSLILGFTNLETLTFAGILKVGRDTIIDIGLDTTRNVSGLQNTEEIKFLEEAKTRSSNNGHFTNEEFNKIVNITSAIMYFNGIDQTQQYLAPKMPTYYYRSSFDYSRALHRLLGIHKDGAGHADDVLHLFWSPYIFQSLDLKSDIGIQRTRMVKMYTNFAKYGNPTPDGDSDPILKINWPVSDAEGTYLEIDKNYSVGKRPINDFVRHLQEEMKPLLRKRHECQ